jgi:transglutaminase-like putative cysteine protease
MDDYEKVYYWINYIRSNYAYPDSGTWVSKAFVMVIEGEGDCWAGNSLLATLCAESGIPCTIYDASSGNGAGHRRCKVKIGSEWYVADATPQGSGLFTPLE